MIIFVLHTGYDLFRAILFHQIVQFFRMTTNKLSRIGKLRAAQLSENGDVPEWRNNFDIFTKLVDILWIRVLLLTDLLS